MAKALGGLGHGDDEDDPYGRLTGEAHSTPQPFNILFGPHTDFVRISPSAEPSR